MNILDALRALNVYLASASDALEDNERVLAHKKITIARRVVRDIHRAMNDIEPTWAEE